MNKKYLFRSPVFFVFAQGIVLPHIKAQNGDPLWTKSQPRYTCTRTHAHTHTHAHTTQMCKQKRNTTEISGGGGGDGGSEERG